jgi:hypothetical protein
VKVIRRVNLDRVGNNICMNLCRVMSFLSKVVPHLLVIVPSYNSCSMMCVAGLATRNRTNYNETKRRK